MTKTRALALLVLVVGTLLYLINEYYSPIRVWERHHKTGLIASDKGNYLEAEKALAAALQEAEKFPPGDQRLALTLDRLAEMYRIQGKFEEAERYLQWSLGIEEERYGPDHSQVAARLNNLAENYRARARYAEAEPLYQRTLDIWEKRLGPENSLTLFALENYAGVLRKLRRDKEAEHFEALLKTRRARSAGNPPEN